jgi:hypothetical protein
MTDAELDFPEWMADLPVSEFSRIFSVQTAREHDAIAPKPVHRIAELRERHRRNHAPRPHRRSGAQRKRGFA